MKPNSWASVVGDGDSSLRYVDTSSAFVNGTLRIPKSVIDKGLQKLKAALVAQFLGSVPPIRVISAVVNRIWGYEGEVIVSKIEEGFFLFEFASENLAQWVLKRSWHIHHSVMVLRKWERYIAPIDLSPKNVPTWIVFKKVPAPLITQEGIGWLSSHIGEPVNNFVRNGLDVKVCLLRDVEAAEVAELSITMEDEEEPILIEIEYPQARSYSKPKLTKEWKRISPVEDIELEKVVEDSTSSGKEKEEIPTVEVTSMDEQTVNSDKGEDKTKEGGEVSGKTAASTEERLVIVDPPDVRSVSSNKNPFSVLCELGNDDALSVEAFPPLKADVRRVSERNKKKGSPGKK
ncbi:hypothetical protein LINPERPRIM_LOCUS36529 [Linum perenne]